MTEKRGRYIMKKLIRITAAVLTGLMILSASACNEKKNEEYPLKMAGIEITEKPQRVLCLSDSLADIMINLLKNNQNNYF